MLPPTFNFGWMDLLHISQANPSVILRHTLRFSLHSFQAGQSPSQTLIVFHMSLKHKCDQILLLGPIRRLFMLGKFQPPKITSPKVGASFHAAQGEVRFKLILKVFSVFISRVWASLALRRGIPTLRCIGVGEGRPPFTGDLFITLLGFCKHWWCTSLGYIQALMLLSIKVWRTDGFSYLLVDTLPRKSLLDV